MRTFVSLYDKQKEKCILNNSKTVESSFEFVKIGEIDTLKEAFQAEVNIESKWMLHEDIEIYDPKINWNPSLYVENSLIISETISYDIIKENGVKFVIESRSVKGEFFTNKKYVSFKSLTTINNCFDKEPSGND